MNGRWGWFILFLCSIFVAIMLVFVHFDAIFPHMGISLMGPLVLLLLGLKPLYEFIKIGHLEDNGERVLGEPIKYKWHWWASGTAFTVVCKIPGEDSKMYKGICRIRFKEMMEGNNNLKYVPIYLSRNRKNLYYVNCEEVSEIVKHGRYNGHTIEELQGL